MRMQRYMQKEALLNFCICHRHFYNSTASGHFISIDLNLTNALLYFRKSHPIYAPTPTVAGYHLCSSKLTNLSSAEVLKMRTSGVASLALGCAGQLGFQSAFVSVPIWVHSSHQCSTNIIRMASVLITNH